jgi:hypothetical protein
MLQALKHPHPNGFGETRADPKGPKHPTFWIASPIRRQHNVFRTLLGMIRIAPCEMLCDRNFVTAPSTDFD